MRRTFAVLLFSCCMARSVDTDARSLFERARMLAENNQDLKEAIRLFTQVIDAAKLQPALAAQAQYRLGLIYDRIGKGAEAQKAYRAVVRDFAAQKDIVALARAKLPAVPPVPGIHRVWKTDCFFGPASPDGRLITFTSCTAEGQRSQGNLAVYDRQTGEERRITHREKGEEMLITGPAPSVFSPDGKSLAYGWKDGMADEVRLIKLDGSGQRTLFRAPTDAVVRGIQHWSYDGRHVLAMLCGRERTANLCGNPVRLVMISVADGSWRTIPTPPQWRGGRSLFSPDGHYILYSFTQAGSSQRMDIHSISIAEGTDTPVVENPANDYMLGWAPDKETLVFNSDRAVRPAIYGVRIRDGRAVGPPQMLYKDLNVSRPLNLTNQGSLLYVPQISDSDGFDVFLVGFDPDTSHIVTSPKPVSERFDNTKKNQAWSPDGSEMVYITPQGLVFHSMVTGSDRDLPLPPELTGIFEWSRDGHYLFAYGGTGGTRGMIQMDIQTGQTRLVAKDVIDEPAFSADGNTIYHSDQLGHLVSRHLPTGTVQTLYTSADPRAINSALTALSPDGRMLAFRLSDTSGKTPGSIVIMPVSGGEPLKQIAFPTPGAWAGGGLVWTPDMRYILAPRAANGQTTVWKIPVDGSQPEQAGLVMQGNVRRIRLHPNGRQLSFVRIETPPTDEIWVLDNFLATMPSGQKRR